MSKAQHVSNLVPYLGATVFAAAIYTAVPDNPLQNGMLAWLFGFMVCSICATERLFAPLTQACFALAVAFIATPLVQQQIPTVTQIACSLFCGALSFVFMWFGLRDTHEPSEKLAFFPLLGGIFSSLFLVTRKRAAI